QEALVRSHRRCNVCHEFGGRSVNVHHITQEADGGPNTLENAICLCLRCHAEAGHFNLRHPLGTKYSPAELAAHRDQWLAHCAAHPDEPVGLALDVAFRSVRRSSDIHLYRLLVSYTNTTSVAHDNWKVQIYLPSFVPCSQCEFDAYENEELEGSRYTKFEAQSHERVFPGETIRIAGQDPSPFPFIEYEVTNSVYRRALQGGDVRWRFYTSNAPIVEGGRQLSELHEF